MKRIHIEEYWAGFFGLSIAEFLEPGLKVVPHSGLHGYHGAWLFTHGSSSIISVPSELIAKVERQTSDTITEQKFVALFGDEVNKVVGPAYQGFLDTSDFRPAKSSARILSLMDDESLNQLRAACDEKEWEHSAIEIGQHPTFGLFVGSDLVAVSTYVVESLGVAAPGIITRPDCRGFGYGKAVLSAATGHGLDARFLMLYQTLLLNEPSIAIARSLGYKQYATHLAVRFR